MRLRAQILLAACGTALVWGGLGTWFVGRRAAAVGLELLDAELSNAQTALQRQWQLRRRERESTFASIAAQSYFRAYLMANDQAQMSYFANLVQQKGAHQVVIVDAERRLMASAGPSSGALPRLCERAKASSG